jgi:hypothetical protein
MWGRRMEPAGIKFGLSRNLLQLDGAAVIVTPDVFDAISELARRQVLTGSSDFGSDFPYPLISEAIPQVLPPRELEKDVEGEIDSFCKGIGRALYDSLTALGVRAHIGFLCDSTFVGTDEFMGDLEDGIQATAEVVVDRNQLFFEVCRATVAAYFARHDPASARRADLFTLFLMNKWIHPIDSLKKHFFPSR